MMPTYLIISIHWLAPPTFFSLNQYRQLPRPRLAALAFGVRPPVHPPCSIFPSLFEPPSPCSFSVRSAPLWLNSAGPRFSTQSQRSSAILSLNIDRWPPRFSLLALAFGVGIRLIRGIYFNWASKDFRQVVFLDTQRLVLIQKQCIAYNCLH